MKKNFNQSGIIHTLPLLIIIAAVGIISFLLISSTAPINGLLGKLNPKPASKAQQMMMTAQDFCKFMTAPATTAAFCDTFDMAHPGGRGGDLDETRWDVSRVYQWMNLGQGAFDGAFTMNTQRCKTLVSGVNADNDSFFCGLDQNPPESNHWMTAMNDNGNYNVLSGRVRQPFDFASRTGTITYDVDSIGLGHVWWPEVMITDEPIPNPYQDIRMPKNGIAITFENPGCDDGNMTTAHNQPGAIWIFNNYNGTYYPPIDGTSPTGGGVRHQIGGCYATGFDQANHFEIKISQDKLEIWASDKTVDGGATYPNFKLRVSITNAQIPFTRGYVHFQHGQYNASKEGFDSNHTYHWHAIGFDGPTLPTPRAYDVPDALAPRGGFLNMGYSADVNGQMNNGNSNVPPFNLQNVDLTNATSAKLNVSVWYLNQPPLPVMYRFNGGAWRSYNIPPVFASSDDSGLPVSMPISLTDLKQGNNTLEFKSSNPSGQSMVFANTTLELYPGDINNPVSSSTPIPTMTPMPSMSTMPACPKASLGDINCNGTVDIFDYSTLVGNYNKSGVSIPGDLNNDGLVNLFDYNILVGNFGK